MTTQPVAVFSNGAENAAPPGERLPHRLDTASRVRREMARVYRLARPLAVDVADYSRLSNMLHMLHRAIEAGEIERRVEALEQAQANR